MRCENCQKFVSYDTEVEPEESNSPELEDGVFTASFTRTLSCAECGSEMKQAEIEVSVDATITEPEDKEEPECDICGFKESECQGQDDTEAPHDFEPHEEHEHDWQCESDDLQPTERMQTHDRHGKPIKNYRYMRRYYGVSGTLRATCDCGATAEAAFEADEQASAFDEVM